MKSLTVSHQILPTSLHLETLERYQVLRSNLEFEGKKKGLLYPGLCVLGRGVAGWRFGEGTVIVVVDAPGRRARIHNAITLRYRGPVGTYNALKAVFFVDVAAVRGWNLRAGAASERTCSKKTGS